MMKQTSSVTVMLFSGDDATFPEFDQPITVSEIIQAVKTLKTCKTTGNYYLLNEYFIEGIDILSSHLCDLFNSILNSGYFPDHWSEGIIVPVHKKGDASNVENYRGITLVSCMSKLFTSILNKRITVLCDKFNIISDAQFGFRKGRSTVDTVFVLMSVIQKFMFENKRLYVVFVDLMKCYDTIIRNVLWLKLFKLGINGFFLCIIKDIYRKV